MQETKDVPKVTIENRLSELFTIIDELQESASIALKKLEPILLPAQENEKKSGVEVKVVSPLAGALEAIKQQLHNVNKLIVDLTQRIDL